MAKMIKLHKCIACSTFRNPVYVKPKTDREGYHYCPKCGSIELEPVYKKK